MLEQVARFLSRPLPLAVIPLLYNEWVLTPYRPFVLQKHISLGSWHARHHDLRQIEDQFSGPRIILHPLVLHLIMQFLCVAGTEPLCAASVLRLAVSMQ